MLATFTVNSTGGAGDSYLEDNICDTAARPDLSPPRPASGLCTLTAALEQANVAGGTIEFAENRSYSGPDEFELQQAVTIRGPATIMGTDLTLLGDGNQLLDIRIDGLATIAGSSGNIITGSQIGSAALENVTGTNIQDSQVTLTLKGGTQTAIVNSSIGGDIRDSNGTQVESSRLRRNLQVTGSQDTSIRELEGSFAADIRIENSSDTTVDLVTLDRGIVNRCRFDRCNGPGQRSRTHRWSYFPSTPSGGFGVIGGDGPGQHRRRVHQNQPSDGRDAAKK